MNRLILLLVLLVLITGCSVTYIPDTAPEPEEEKEIIIDDEPIVEEEEEEEVVEEEPISCEEWAETLFPVQWIFKQDVTNDPKYEKNPLSLGKGKWKDDVSISGVSSTTVEKGSETGENINYYYTKPIFLTVEEYGFVYSNKMIDDEGNILGINAFKIKPAYKVIHDTVKLENNTRNHTVSIRYLSLIMQKPNFESCEKVE